MTDIDETLRAYADRWTQAEPCAPDLDDSLARARASRNRRIWPVLVAVACAVALAAGLTVTLSHHGPGSSASDANPAVELAKLQRIARSAATSGGDPYASADAVRTTWRRAEEVMDAKSEPNVPDDAIWLIQIHGSRLGDASWIGPAGTGPAPGPYLVLGVPIGRSHGGFEGIRQHPVDLALLGTVIRLFPAGTPPIPARLRQLARVTARQNSDPKAGAQAVRTDLRSAERVVDDSKSGEPDHAVWLIQLTGRFTCGVCKGVGPPPKGRYITLIVDAAAPYRTAAFGIGNAPVDLASLGKVITLLP